MHIFKKSEIKNKKNVEQKSMKICMFFGTSLLNGFWEGLRRVLGGLNPWVLHFFRYFFEAKFRLPFGRTKNRKKRPQKFFSWIFGGMCGPGGKDPHNWRTKSTNVEWQSNPWCQIVVFGFLGILPKNLEKIVPAPSQIEPRGFKNRVRGHQNRARSPPRRYF